MHVIDVVQVVISVVAAGCEGDRAGVAVLCDGCGKRLSRADGTVYLRSSQRSSQVDHSYSMREHNTVKPLKSKISANPNKFLKNFQLKKHTHSERQLFI